MKVEIKYKELTHDLGVCPECDSGNLEDEVQAIKSVKKSKKGIKVIGKKKHFKKHVYLLIETAYPSEIECDNPHCDYVEQSDYYPEDVVNVFFRKKDALKKVKRDFFVKKYKVK